jgi:hypothetical protein
MSASEIVRRYQLVDGPEEYQIAALTLAVVMLALDHEKVLGKRGGGHKMSRLKHDIFAITPGRSWTADSGGCGIEEWSECLQDREEMG